MRPLCRILLVGGSGKRAEAAILPAVRAMQDSARDIEVRIAAICDPVDPRSRTDHPHLRWVLECQAPAWIPATGRPADDEAALDRFLLAHPIDLAVLSSGPTTHLAYARWAVRHGLRVICDKPPHVTPGAASDPNAAAAILPDYDALLTELAARRTISPALHASVTLSRRTWPPVRHLFALGEAAKEGFGQGITQCHVILNNGIHRFPAELADSGAHGFRHGTGLLTHSAYHYLDLAAALLDRFPPAGLASRVLSLGHVQRLRDDVRSDVSKALRELCGEPGHPIPPELSEAAWGCESSVHAHLAMRSRERRALGYCSFSFNNATFTPRDFPSRPGVDNPDNLGMRMAQLIIDVHFGALANVRILQNHLAGEPPTVSESIRLHPRFAESTGLAHGDRTYTGEELKPTAGGGLFRENILEAMGVGGAAKGSLVDFESHRPTVALFSECYRALAAHIPD